MFRFCRLSKSIHHQCQATCQQSSCRKSWCQTRGTRWLHCRERLRRAGLAPPCTISTERVSNAPIANHHLKDLNWCPRNRGAKRYWRRRSSATVAEGRQGLSRRVPLIHSISRQTSACAHGGRDGSGRRFQSSMEKDGDASIAVVRRYESRLFIFLRGNAKRREGRRGLILSDSFSADTECPIVHGRRRMERSLD